MTGVQTCALPILQKAFKRGRLEKGPGGKYRLNASWEGGSVRLSILAVFFFFVAEVN